jgi:hypothetical protein
MVAFEGMKFAMSNLSKARLTRASSVEPALKKSSAPKLLLGLVCETVVSASGVRVVVAAESGPAATAIKKSMSHLKANATLGGDMHTMCYNFGLSSTANRENVKGSLSRCIPSGLH